MDYGVLNSAEGEFYLYLFFINHEQLIVHELNNHKYI